MSGDDVPGNHAVGKTALSRRTVLSGGVLAILATRSWGGALGLRPRLSTYTRTYSNTY